MDRLIADIGGTNARFALAGPDGRPHDEQRLLVADFPGPVEAARAYLGGRKVRDAVFAIKDFDGALGKWSFDENGDITLPYFLVGQVQSGKFEAFGTFTP